MFRKRFVIHEHHATRLHWDLRLEMGDVFKSWAVPKGPSLNPADKRLAVEVGDHALKYGDFEGRIAEGNYGAGDVRIWDNGKYETPNDPLIQLKKGKIALTFFGLKLRGEFILTRMYRDPKNWLLIKVNDHFADPEWLIETILPRKKNK
ncbi:MAG: DNA polymerase ligase N-terminal domain-containing protein [Acidobacteriota bacterium]